MNILIWNAGIPDVAAGSQEAFWCAYRERENGPIYHRLLCYCNGYIMPLSDSCYDVPEGVVVVGDDGDYAWTGWFERSCDQCDTQWGFSGEVIAWMRLPRFTQN